jgi:hypothetical protein
MKRLLLYILFPAFLSGGCTDRVLQYDASRPPLDVQTRIPILPAIPEGYARPNRFVYGDAADILGIPREGTSELSNSLFARDQNENDPCDDSFTNGATCMACYLACAPLALAAGLVYLPYLAATGQMKADKSEDTASPRQLQARWLASVVDNQQWAPVLDAAYISGLYEALGWEAPDGPQPPPSFWSAPKRETFFAYISKIALVDTDQGEHTLLLCARSTIHRSWGSMPRTIETCQSGHLEFAVSIGSPANGDALRAALVERARQLSAVQAKELCPACAPGQ